MFFQTMASVVPFLRPLTPYNKYILILSCLLFLAGIFGRSGFEIREIKILKISRWQAILAFMCSILFFFLFLSLSYSTPVSDEDLPRFDVNGKFILWNYDEKIEELKVKVVLEGIDKNADYKLTQSVNPRTGNILFTGVTDGWYNITVHEKNEEQRSEPLRIDKDKNLFILTKYNNTYDIKTGDWVEYIVDEYNTNRANWKMQRIAADILERFIDDRSRFLKIFKYVSISLRLIGKTCEGDEHSKRIQEYIMHSSNYMSDHAYLQMRGAQGLMCFSETKEKARDFLFEILNDKRKTPGERLASASYLYEKGEGEQLCVIDTFVEALQYDTDPCKYCRYIARGFLTDIATQHFAKDSNQINHWDAKDFNNWWQEERAKLQESLQWKKNCL